MPAIIPPLIIPFNSHSIAIKIHITHPRASPGVQLNAGVRQLKYTCSLGVVRHGPKPGGSEAEAEAEALTELEAEAEAEAFSHLVLEAEAEAEALCTKPKPKPSFLMAYTAK